MTKYIINRFIQLIFIMLVVSFLTFFITSILPSDPVTMKYESMNQQVSKNINSVPKIAKGKPISKEQSDA